MHFVQTNTMDIDKLSVYWTRRIYVYIHYLSCLMLIVLNGLKLINDKILKKNTFHL